MKLTLNLLFVICVVGVQACIDVEKGSYKNQPFRLWDGNRGLGFRWGKESEEQGSTMERYYNPELTDKEDEVLTLMILENDVTVEYYTYMSREDKQQVAYLREDKIKVFYMGELMDDPRTKFFLTDIGSMGMVREDGSLWWLHADKEGKLFMSQEEKGVIQISDVCGSSKEVGWDEKKDEGSWEQPPDMSPEQMAAMQEMATIDWSKTTSCVRWDTIELFKDGDCKEKTDKESEMMFAMENSAGPNWGTPGCLPSSNLMKTKEWFTQTYCGDNFVEMSLHTDPGCAASFEEIKINFEKGESMCTNFGSSGYYFTIKQNMMDGSMDPGMTEEDWKKQVDKEMDNLNWKDTTSCIDWESARLYYDEMCATPLDDESSMKFAMENSAGPNWGTPGCHHSKNAMGDKEWFTQTYCDKDFIEMSLHKNPECTEWFDEVKFQFEKGESMCTSFGTSGYYITVKQNMNRMEMDTATDHGMTEEDWKKQVDKEMDKLNWKDTTSCIDWEST